LPASSEAIACVRADALDLAALVQHPETATAWNIPAFPWAASRAIGVVNMVGSCNMLRAPGNPVPGATHEFETAALPAVAEATSRTGAVGWALGASAFGAVRCEQAVIAREAIIAAVTRSLWQVIGLSPD